MGKRNGCVVEQARRLKRKKKKEECGLDFLWNGIDSIGRMGSFVKKPQMLKFDTRSLFFIILHAPSLFILLDHHAAASDLGE
jgi:hypothetical protein